MNNNEYDEFKNLIQDMVNEGIQNYLKDAGMYKSHTGEIIQSNENGTFSVDTSTTVLHNLENKSNSQLEKGDTVTLFEKYGSNYSNCFILAKNGQNRKEEQPHILTEEEVKQIVNEIIKNDKSLLKKSEVIAVSTDGSGVSFGGDVLIKNWS